MARIDIRSVNNRLLKALRRRASREGVSLPELVRGILLRDQVNHERAPKRLSKAELIKEMDRIAAMSPPITKPPFSEHLIREDRDTR